MKSEKSDNTVANTYGGAGSLRKIRKLSFDELVSENKKALLKDAAFLDKIEERLEQRYKEEK
ncbi:FbpB family small basic protein [Metabacillus mangrovi]|uniref:FbpB family small basic protein n=1 Tax=Metabacillus mangrovi TaxID=1491830 RepID=UPI0013DE27F5